MWILRMPLWYSRGAIPSDETLNMEGHELSCSRIEPWNIETLEKWLSLHLPSFLLPPPLFLILIILSGQFVCGIVVII